MNEPQISLSGNLAFDPRLRYTPNGVAVVDLRIASTQRRKVGEAWEDGETLDDLGPSSSTFSPTGPRLGGGE